LEQEQREWADIDPAWLQDYLEEHDLAIGYDLEDDLIGSQVSWILSPEEWSELRNAWEQQQPKSAVDDADTQAAQPANRQVTPKQPVEAVESQGSESKSRTSDQAGLEAARNELDRLNELIQKALSDWSAFRELFGNCPDCVGIDAWETLAESPAVLLIRAEKMLAAQRVADEVRNRKTEQEREDEIAQIRNILFGYHIYCRKHRHTPSLEHALVFIPDLATKHATDVVQEAWRREAESQ
jgi:hypothetical protein